MMKPHAFSLLSFFCNLAYSEEIWTETYKVVDGIKLQNPYKTTILNHNTISLCAFQCLRERGICSSANYDGFSKCELNTYSPLDEQSTITEDAAWRILYVKDDTWELVFRGTSGIGTKLYPYYTGSAISPSLPEVGCLFTHTLTCTTHYRNDAVLNNWESQNIKKVKVALYKNNVTVVDFVFTNSINDSYMDWFSKDNLINSTYTNLTDPSQTFNYFSITGDGFNIERRFYINRDYNGCHNDYGWLAVLEMGTCSYESNLQVPNFAYMANNTAGHWQQGFQSADVFAIFIQR